MLIVFNTKSFTLSYTIPALDKTRNLLHLQLHILHYWNHQIHLETNKKFHTKSQLKKHSQSLHKDPRIILASWDIKVGNINTRSIYILTQLRNPINIYLFKVNNRNTRKKYEICSHLHTLLTLNIFHTFF